jgi:hypothetical protein
LAGWGVLLSWADGRGDAAEMQTPIVSSQNAISLIRPPHDPWDEQATAVVTKSITYPKMESARAGVVNSFGIDEKAEELWEEADKYEECAVLHGKGRGLRLS